MSRAYVARGEDRILDEAARASTAGSYVTQSDGVTHYRLAGPGTEPLVLLTPGITIPLGYWDAIAADLHAGGLRTLAYSAYGRGWSDRVEGRYDQALFVRQLGELLDAVAPVEPVHLVGTSMGGLLAIAHATRPGVPAPLSLTLIGPAGLSARRPPLTRLLAVDPLARVLGTHFGHRLLDSHLGHNVRSPQDAERLRRLVGEPYRFHGSIHALLSTLRNFPLAAQHDLYRRAGRLPVPKLLLWGRHDRVTPIDQLESVRELFQPDDSHLFDHCGHMVPFEDPHGTARLLAAFFRTITGERSA
ncbi:alpha/beta fold hydrolase [Streptomyces sp. P9(2023)]|uniref:alpha/beta fold hydrolase n=1 Tax=Streptomyces sp. P9(2023) TaxID=3064394 RepID=UPI0028F406B8|nr:alpha/beta fold hydrolase [Streptomyces sp. P9(2023)]MDT9686962.1 alpha/beta fold hydrolase [Streptomyces sp. P9(2023)]